MKPNANKTYTTYSRAKKSWTRQKKTSSEDYGWDGIISRYDYRWISRVYQKERYKTMTSDHSDIYERDHEGQKNHDSLAW